MPEDSEQRTGQDWALGLLSSSMVRVLIGASIAMLTAQVMGHHAHLQSVDGVLTLISGTVVWAMGMSLTIHPVAVEYRKLRSTIEEGL